jgi:hypothetical protein
MATASNLANFLGSLALPGEPVQFGTGQGNRPCSDKA